MIPLEETALNLARSIARRSGKTIAECMGLCWEAVRQANSEYIGPGEPAYIFLMQRGRQRLTDILRREGRYTRSNKDRRVYVLFSECQPRTEKYNLPPGVYAGKEIDYDTLASIPRHSSRIDEDRLDLAEALTTLKPRTRKWLLAWSKGATMKEIGRKSGVSESRVCQIMRAAFRQLCKRLSPVESKPPTPIARRV